MVGEVNTVITEAMFTESWRMNRRLPRGPRAGELSRQEKWYGQRSEKASSSVQLEHMNAEGRGQKRPEHTLPGRLRGKESVVTGSHETLSKVTWSDVCPVEDDLERASFLQ